MPYFKRPGNLLFTIVGFAEEYYTLLDQKHPHLQAMQSFEKDKITLPVAPEFSYQTFLRNYAGLSEFATNLYGFQDLATDFTALAKTSPTILGARFNLINDALTRWAKDNGLLRIGTLIDELLLKGRELFAENERYKGKASKNPTILSTLFTPEQIELCQNGLIIQLQNIIEALIAENAMIIGPQRASRGCKSIATVTQTGPFGTSAGAQASGAGAAAFTSAPSPIPEVYETCSICLNRAYGYKICKNGHFICKNCIPLATINNYFRGKGLQTYKCFGLGCEQTPTESFLALIKPIIQKNDTAWQLDSAVSNCTNCSKPFSFWTRKHHCRRCGLIICQDCSIGTRDQRICKV